MRGKSETYSGIPAYDIIETNDTNAQEPKYNNRGKHECHPMSTSVL
jgi:hypothetical protein